MTLSTLSDALDLNRRSTQLLARSASRYQITVQVAKRAKRFHYEEFHNSNPSEIKPVARAILEMSDELMQPQLLVEDGG
ncbi:DNA-directed RNA polymerase subunit omega [Lyngbya sp. CCY1209]|uniref:DNA-directed RNA polymerase subunit omega n=1 Tax=Lyngbya sp. CCY1209 TaxID=2886103 RepID=UPI002D211728|nr:DNA-directed RNA polymerase subunit omega [Lyngbya sp. CCY1209]MEB3884326.1 DNA-directed RNA polymerase subunit omega [Lyngbya sp. CCY1209]